MRCATVGFFAFVLTLMSTFVANADDTPFRKRRRRGVRPNRRAAQIIDANEWPKEPASPRKIDAAKFAKGLRQLCGWMPKGRPERWTGYILDAADEHKVDAFLLGAISHRMGRCSHKATDLKGYGLTLIHDRMYRDGLKRGQYRYWVNQKNDWVQHSLELNRFPFNSTRLLLPKENLYFAAAFLSSWNEQHQHNDGFFDQNPHRHYVSHFIWGDSVRSARAEDRILTDRRRLLQYYGAVALPSPIHFRGYSFGTPLDGAPRVISSWLGAAREDGSRKHRGIDVESVRGEPIRAIADGKVNFAGVDLPGSRSNKNLHLREYQDYPVDTLGNGGRYVCVFHRGGEGWLRSCYMHMDEVKVSLGDQVKRGDVLGTVGRTGMKISSPHLHLELHADHELLDASKVLSAFLLGHNPDATKKKKRRRR